MFERCETNPYLLSWDDFISGVLGYAQEDDPAVAREKMNKFFTRHGPPHKHVIVFTHPLKISPSGATVVNVTKLEDVKDAAANIGIPIRFLLSEPEAMAFGTDWPHIEEHLYIFKMCLSPMA